MQAGYERAWRRWDAVAVVGIAGWLLFDLTARAMFGSVPWPHSAVDYRILYDSGRHVFETHQYPAGYPYPPPAAAVHAASAVLPFSVAASLWLALTGVAAGSIYLCLARVLGLHRRPGGLVLLPLAYALVAYYFQWDVRSVNCNLVVLATVVFGCAALVRGRDAGAGFMFAASVALKLFPVLVLPYLAWARRWRALGWAVSFSAVFWGAVPAVVYGVGGTGDVYRGWADELTRATDPATKAVHPILISLDKAAAHLAAGDAGRARGITLGVCAAWVLVGLA
ncbi:MAG: glycosyltransferase family 87 protein, partial [Gemmata sp.]